MKKILATAFLLSAIVLGIVSCSDKGGGGGGGGASEANLVIILNPPANSVQPAAPQTDFPLTVSITSAMPPQGVTIDVKAAPEGSTTNFFTETRSSTSATNNFTITSTPVGVVCVVTVTVTSKTKATNTVTASYRYSRK
ncbi:MAG TPA: hypothetical protein VFP97_05980 [Chitinophagaceae bacterium]|nr:hypothetical protein [Chitinophagaceae bacterium]